MIHHSATADGATFSWDAIRRYHRDERGWSDIGYHFGVELVGEQYEMLVGRPLLARAAAAREQGMNRWAVHVCFVGNYDDSPPPLSMLQFAAPRIADVMEALCIKPERDLLIPHRLVASYKSCPGARFDMEQLRTLIKGA